ncbi:hypothetical protein BKM31_37715 [[Actinomadura] parvosata subsp. kistnae]|uniref:Uncharacterized protein n=1 Tax=[Actinomadura] parvosata subsp. kistnae TaxID=1909395 RepID=A0A1V0A8D6_9ACTN|nr:hypothetical protein [Nonomuraea sp. ATCC 55076]AQZ66422.1 hypothetical protein BKM31_37715 [Nonomuraea sp. ATCC 55076]
MSRWRYLRWWAAAFAAGLLSFLSLWLPGWFEGDGAVGCAGYGPLPSGLAALWSEVETIWLDLRQHVETTYGWFLPNGLPMAAVLVSGAAASRPGRRLATLAGLVAALLVTAVALHWALMAFSYFLLADCTGWEARLLPWMGWRLLMAAGYACTTVLLLAGVHARRAAPAQARLQAGPGA